MIGACRDEDRSDGYHCHAVHFGETGGPAPKTVASFEPGAFREFAQYFCRFAASVEGEYNVCFFVAPA